MGNMRPIDSAVVKNETYDVLSADTMGGEYIETIGAACQNPDGYTSGSLFLGKDNDVQHLYRATAAIAFGETIILDTNCVYTTVSGELEGKAEESEVTSLNEALTNEVVTRATNGAHNLLPFDLAKIKSINQNGTWSGNTYTYNGITYTFYLNSDGSLNYIDVDGTTTSANNSIITFNNFTVFKKGNYKLSCTPESVGDYAYTRVTRGFDGTTSSTVYDRGDGAALNLVNDSSDAIYMQIVVDASSSVAHAKFRPMICLASDPSIEYTPYAMTNRELTMRREATTISNINVISSDSVCCLEFAGANLGTVTGAWSSVITLDKKLKTALFYVVEDHNRNLYDLAVNDNGLVQIRTNDQNSHDLTSLRCQIWFALI